MSETRDADDVLAYKNLRIDLDDIRPVIMELQNFLHDVADGRANNNAFDKVSATRDVEGYSSMCSACISHDVDTRDIYATARTKAYFRSSLCSDCCEGLADELEEYAEDNVDELLGEAL